MELNGEPRNKHTHVWSINLRQRNQEYTMEKRQSLQHGCLESWAAPCKSMKLEHSLMPFIKINPKQFKDLNIRHDNHKKFLEENIGKTFLDINCSNIFLDQSPKAKERKAKLNKWNLIKLKRYCTGNETISKTKRQPEEWGKIFANRQLTRDRYPKYTNHSHNSISKQTKNSNKNGQKT